MQLSKFAAEDLNKKKKRDEEEEKRRRSGRRRRRKNKNEEDIVCYLLALHALSAGTFTRRYCLLVAQRPSNMLV